MSSLGTSKGVLEIAKFAVYVTVPIGLMYFFANNTKNLQKFMGTLIKDSTQKQEQNVVFRSGTGQLSSTMLGSILRQYVVYPPEGPLPPSPEELMERAREARKAREFSRQTNNQ
ncbi:hypothetical protein M9H77_35335 [Catharanthus roseus]|uniref:Uncharacterized protein n=1 Tax=Catharanthus roseus TaxID=4058 RepID=A0ACB9ZSD6_CATRO|nr:hypothetical protein M9H77_35335 [Catharanthus roseus]